MGCEVLIDGDSSHERWIEIALSYVPDRILAAEGANLAIIGIGSTAACRLPPQYREREIVLLSDWVFPPAGDSEVDETGRFFIVTVLHEIAHAFRRHKSPALDGLSPEENQEQEAEADRIAIDWFNQHVELSGSEILKPLQVEDFRAVVDRRAKLYEDLEEFKINWHRENGT